MIAITFMLSRKQLHLSTSVCSVVVKTMLVLCLCSIGTATAQSVVNVSSVTELRSAMGNNNQHIIMQPGDYEMGSQTFKLSGNNNIVELTGAYFSWEVGDVGSGRMSITGDGNTIRNGEFEDVYYNGITEVTDFTAYNQDRNRLANGGGSNISITGDNNRLVGFKMTVRGSYPYGY